MFAYNVFLNNVRKYDVGRNAKLLIKRLYFSNINKILFGILLTPNITAESGSHNTPKMLITKYKF